MSVRRVPEDPKESSKEPDLGSADRESRLKGRDATKDPKPAQSSEELISVRGRKPSFEGIKDRDASKGRKPSFEGRSLLQRNPNSM